MISPVLAPDVDHFLPGPAPRRALYPTYNALREGDLRAAYYEQKAIELAGGSSVSLIGDFQGRTV